MFNKSKICLFLLFLCNIASSEAEISSSFQHHFYLGALGGYGTTTWKGLVPTQANQNLALNMSTPIDAQEGGTTWGFFVGHEFTPYFAVEGTYMRFPDANVAFDPISLFSFDHGGSSGFTTRTEVLSVMGKIMLVIPNTRMRVYSSAGGANLHRNDLILNEWRLTPTFGVGINYLFSDHLMGEIGGNYTAGFGESQLNPADTYYPFLASAVLRLAYRF